MNSIEIILKALMKINNLTQIALSLKTDIPLPTIRKYLKSEFNPSHKNIKKIENTFNISIIDLIDRNLNDLTEVENLEYKNNLFLEKILKKIENVEIEKNQFEYATSKGGAVKVPDYNFYEVLEQYEYIKLQIENTLKILNEIKFNLITENKKVDTIFKLDNDILTILKKYNILITPTNEITQDTFKIKLENKYYNISDTLLSNIIEFLKTNLVNDFKSFLEIIDNETDKA